MKKINELFDVEEDFKIVSLHSDSRYVGKDSVFFCLEGLNTDGHKYADDAVFQGAKCIVHSKPLKRKYPGVVYIEVNNVLQELNRVANIFYDYPSLKMTVIGVTGTSGKTVVSLMIKDVLNHYLKMGYIGTNDTSLGNSKLQMTTPEPIYLHKTFNQMISEGVKGVALEVSSHGLALGRVDSVNFDIAVLTNIIEEHLDFHGTVDNLMNAESKLFEIVNENGYCILNNDEVKFIHYLENKGPIKAKKITYGISHQADIMASDIQEYLDHTTFDLSMENERYKVSVPIIGKFNVGNVLAVISILKALEMPMQQIMEALSFVKPIEGRMELIEHSQPFSIIIDYCSYIHNYEEIFKYARSVIKGNGRLIAVIGVQLNRGVVKRQQLGILCNQYLDQVILTQEDEMDDEEIIGFCKEIQHYITNPVSVIMTNRRIAIRQAVELATKDDIILILGKGHEQFMRSNLGNSPYPGDKFVVKQAIKDVFEGGKEDEI